MIYPYICSACDNRWDVIKSLSEIDNAECCEKCGGQGVRSIAPVRTNKVWVEEYNPAFGKVIRSKRHLNEELRRKADEGQELVEVGNEPLENLSRNAERNMQEKLSKRWSESTEKILQEYS